MGDSQEKRSGYTTVSLPVTLHAKVKGLIKGTGFTSVSDYVTYVLREVVAMHESSKHTDPFTDEDKERIRQRLKSLGYID